MQALSTHWCSIHPGRHLHLKGSLICYWKALRLEGGGVKMILLTDVAVLCEGEGAYLGQPWQGAPQRQDLRRWSWRPAA